MVCATAEGRSAGEALVGNIISAKTGGLVGAPRRRAGCVVAVGGVSRDGETRTVGQVALDVTGTRFPWGG